MGSMLDPPVGWDDFRLKDDRGRIMAEPRVAMLMEELAKVKNALSTHLFVSWKLCKPQYNGLITPSYRQNPYSLLLVNAPRSTLQGKSSTLLNIHV